MRGLSRADDTFDEIEAESRRILGEADAPNDNSHQVVPEGEFDIAKEMERIRAKPMINVNDVDED